VDWRRIGDFTPDIGVRSPIFGGWLTNRGSSDKIPA